MLIEEIYTYITSIFDCERYSVVASRRHLPSPTDDPGDF